MIANYVVLFYKMDDFIDMYAKVVDCMKDIFKEKIYSLFTRTLNFGGTSLRSC